jgi:glycosyltransferase involved in cell wall biosynthesis
MTRQAMRLCIDASNLRSGGGLTHLVELLGSVDAPTYGFERVFVWSRESTLRKIADRPWLIKRTHPVLESNPLRRAVWQARLGKLARADGCDLVFVPGGTFTTSFRPIVTMCRNMLPFEWREIRRYGASLQALRFLMLRITQARSFRRASGTIFLTRYAFDAVGRRVGRLSGPAPIIPHGIDSRFFAPVHPQSADANRELELVYVSIVDHYKHQTTVAQAVARLVAQGERIRLTLIGPAYTPALRRLRSVLEKIDPQARVIRYLGPIAHEEIHAAYARADIGVFASSCENMPNILLEQMAAGLPIACSNRGPMPEILGDDGVFFDPEDVDSVCSALLGLIRSAELRARLAHGAQARARGYSWARCAAETFGFLAQVSASFAGSAAARVMT